MKTKRVVICGSGIIGLCSAHYLRERGFEVIVVSRDKPEVEGCSFGNAGMIVPSHFIPLAAPGMVMLGLKWMFDSRSPFYIKPRLSTELAGWCLKFMSAANSAHVERCAPVIRDLSFASRKLYEELSVNLPPEQDFELVKRGLLMLCQTEKGFAEEQHTARRANALGVPAKVLSAKEAAEVDPDITMDIAGAVHFPLDCHLTPQRLMRHLRETLTSDGVDLRWETEVTGWKKQGSRITHITTNSGDIAGDEFVLAGGAWSPGIVKSLGIKLPMQAGKGYSLTLPDPVQLPRLCSILTEARVAITPMGKSLRVGGTMELSGINDTIRPERVQGIVSAVSRYFPAFKNTEFSQLPVWHGLRPCPPDGMPYLGRFDGWSNLCAATGHAMMGLSLGPVTGQIVAQILSGEKPTIDLTTLDPNRYA